MIPAFELRLDKWLADAGVGSRSEVKKIIRIGRVTVNGRPVRDPGAHCAPDSRVMLDGRAVEWQPWLYLMMNKPAGYLSVTADPRQATVMELLSTELRKRNLSPAGRLDKDSEGLLILTSDGDFCHRVISPKSGIEKEYYIEVGQAFPPEAEELFRAGVVLEDGEVCRPAKLAPSADRRSAVVTISEGKYHQVKRMAIAAGVRVTYLKRLSVGGVKLDPALPPGAYRQLTEDERKKILAQCDNLHK